MICPFCCHPGTSVTNSRPRKKTASIWRRRECTRCQRIFSTTESIALQDAILVKSRDGLRTTAYNRGILLFSIASSFAHDVTRGHQAAWWLSDTVEGSLLESSALNAATEPSSPICIGATKIASHCYQVLQRYDQAAAIQYAAKHHLL